MDLERIIEAKFNSIFRCVDMLCFNLGNDIEDREKDTVPEYSFHVQTQWRFVKDNAIILASRDIYTPYDPDINECEWEFDEADRPDDMSSIFDVLKKDFGKYFENAVVASAYVNVLGDLHVGFSNGIQFETFTPSMRKDEFWRFIDFTNTEQEPEHLVVFDV